MILIILINFVFQFKAIAATCEVELNNWNNLKVQKKISDFNNHFAQNLLAAGNRILKNEKIVMPNEYEMISSNLFRLKIHSSQMQLTLYSNKNAEILGFYKSNEKGSYEFWCSKIMAEKP